MLGPLPPMPPPPRHSAFAERANRWGPAGVATVLGALGSLVVSLNLSAELRAKVERHEVELKTHVEALATLKRELRMLEQRHVAFRKNEARWRVMVDGSLCKLSVKVPHGCPPIEYHPEPLRGSKAPRIQPKIVTEPLLETEAYAVGLD